MNECTRSEVYDAIDSERAYQDDKWPIDQGYAMQVGEHILLMAEYIDQARSLWSAESDDCPDPQALHAIRKVAGIAVRCMEQHGAPLRDPA